VKAAARSVARASLVPLVESFHLSAARSTMISTTGEIRVDPREAYMAVPQPRGPSGVQPSDLLSPGVWTIGDGTIGDGGLSID